MPAGARIEVLLNWQFIELALASYATAL
jgi:hypothetical protein